MGPARPGISERVSHVALPGAYLPLKIALLYLIGTVAVFLSGPNAHKVENMPALLLFISVAYGLFALGYRLSAIQARPYRFVTSPERTVTPFVAALVVASSVWFLVFSIASLGEYGATGIGDVLSSLANPTEGYFNKFNVYLEQQLTGRVSLPIQITVLTGALYFVLIPVAVFYWKNLNSFLRLIAVLGIGSYLIYFIFIGTQKGLGDVFMMLLAALAGSISFDSVTAVREKYRKRSRRWLAVVAILLSLGFIVIVANLQGERAETSGVSGQYPGNPTITALFGESFSTGMTLTIFYPTHGYLGLSKNLGMPFEFSGGASVPAVASYIAQYSDAPDPMELSYPVRTEAIDGWPAGMYWATIFPWLASDLTFPGAALFMALFGWFLARMWIGARFERDPLALVLFSIAAVAIIYIPANNQIMISRYTAIGAVTLIGIYALRGLLKGGHRGPVVTK